MKKGFLTSGASSRDDASSGRNVDGSSPSGPPQTGELPESSSGLGCHYPKMVAVLKHRSSPIQGSGENECEFHILGTAHVSSESCNDVRKVIRKVKPDLVMLELCNARSGLLNPRLVTKVPTIAEMIDDYKSGKMPLMGVVYSWLLARIAEHLEVMPGEEFRVALAEAKAIRAKVVLGDRDVNVTLKRTWAALSAWQKAKFLWNLIYTGINVPDADELSNLLEEMKETDMVTEAIKELSKDFPSLAEPLIYERDRYMVHTLHSLSSVATKVVAVVGAGHLPGIRENWDKEIDVREISRIPEPQASWVSWRALTILAGCTTIGVIILTRTSMRRR